MTFDNFKRLNENGAEYKEVIYAEFTEPCQLPGDYQGVF